MELMFIDWLIEGKNNSSQIANSINDSLRRSEVQHQCKFDQIFSHEISSVIQLFFLTDRVWNIFQHKIQKG